MSDDDVPFAIGSLYGVRDWRVGSAGNLHPIAFDNYAWKDGENTAQCHRAMYSWQAEARPCLSWDHGCGFYAYHGLGARTQGEVTGVIQAYGRLAIGSRGFRAEKAKIVALCLPDKPTWTIRLWRCSATLFIAALAVLVALELLFYILIVLFDPFNGWAVLVGTPVGFLVCHTLAYGARTPVRSTNCDPVRAAKIQARYPSVRIYRSKFAMAARYGLLSPHLRRKTTTGPGAFGRAGC